MRSKIGVGLLGVAVAFLLATNPVVVNAAGQITSAQIKNNTIKSKDIKDNQVKSADVKDSSLTGGDIQDASLGAADLAADARGAKVVQYPVNVASHNFNANSLICANLPVSAAEVRSSSWSAGMEASGIYFTVGNWGLGPSSEYRVSVEPDTGRACIIKASGGGETYTNISFYRTTATSTATAVTPVPRPRSRG
jgi:hypothetical protein